MEHAFRQGQQIFQQQTGSFVGEPLQQQLLQTYLFAAGQVPQAIPPRWTSHWTRSPSPLPSRSISPVPVVSPILAPRVIQAPNRSLSPHRVRSKSPQQPHSRFNVWLQIPTARMSRSGTPVPREEPTSPLRRWAHGKVAPRESGQGGKLQPGLHSTPIGPTHRELSPHVCEALPGRQTYPVVRSISPKPISPQLPLQQGFGFAARVPRPVFLHSTPQPAQPQEHMLLCSAPDYLTQTTSMPMPRSSGTPTHSVTEHFPPHSRQTLPIDKNTLQSSTDKEQMAEMLGTLWHRTSAFAEDCARWNHALREKQKEAADLADMIQTFSKQFASSLPQSLSQPSDQFVSMDRIHEPLTSTSEATAATAAIDQAIGILVPSTRTRDGVERVEVVQGVQGFQGVQEQELWTEAQEATEVASQFHASTHSLQSPARNGEEMREMMKIQVVDEINGVPGGIGIIGNVCPQSLEASSEHLGVHRAVAAETLAATRYPSKDLPQDLPQLDPEESTTSEGLSDPGSLLIPGWEEPARRPPDPVSPPSASAESTNTHGDHGPSLFSDPAWVHSDADEFEGMAPATVFEDGSAEMRALVNECLMAPVHASPGPKDHQPQPVEQQAVQPLTWDSLGYLGISSGAPSKASGASKVSSMRPRSAKVELPLEKSAPKATPKMSRPSRPSPKASRQSDDITSNKANRSQSGTPLPKSRSPQPGQKAPQVVELEAKQIRSFLRSLSRPRSKATPTHPPSRG